MSLFLRIILFFFIKAFTIYGYVSLRNNINNIKLIHIHKEIYKLPSSILFNSKSTDQLIHNRKISIITSLGVVLFNYFMIPINEVNAKTEYPSLEKCFNAIENELSTKGESLPRINNDIDKLNWDDLKLFTREYDAGFRNGVLKPIWKQLKDEDQKLGIEISNSFTFDLIALNKAARNEDVNDAKIRLSQVKHDLEDFMKLKKF